MEGSETEPLLPESSNRTNKESDNIWSKKDGPLGWTVATAIMLINFIIIGLGRMSGILYVDFIKDYHVDREFASAPFSFQQSARNLFGPLVGILGHKYGIKSVTFAGGLIGASSAAACAFADDMVLVTVFWGGFYGCSIAFTSTLSQVILDGYFDRDLSSASGLTFAGGSIGAMVFSLVLQRTIDDYGLKNTYLIMGAIILLVLPLSMTLTNPIPEEAKNNTDATASLSKRNSILEASLDMSGNYADAYKNMLPEHVKRNSSDTDVPPNRKLEDAPTDIVNMPSSEISVPPDYKNMLPEHVKRDSSDTDVPPNRKLEDVTTDIANMPSSEISVPPDSPNINSENTRHCSFIRQLQTALKLYINPAFLIICFCRVVHLITFMGVLTFIVDFSMDRGLLESDGKYAIASMSLGDLIGRLCTGWITDFKFLSLEKFMLITLILVSIISISMPFVPPSTILILVCIYSILQGSLFIRHTVLVSKYTKKEERTMAMGFMTLFSGLLGFLMPLYIGHFRDIIGSYNPIFYINGGLCAVIGFLWLPEKWLSRFIR